MKKIKPLSGNLVVQIVLKIIIDSNSCLVMSQNERKEKHTRRGACQMGHIPHSSDY